MGSQDLFVTVLMVAMTMKKIMMTNIDCFNGDDGKGWLGIAKLKPLVERYSCQPMRRLDTSNNLSVGPSCM